MPRKVWLTTVGALIALAALLGTLPAGAESSCRTQCWEAYGMCYKSTSKRQRCQGLLYRCLKNCLRAKKR
jgi:hypothetical protein